MNMLDSPLEALAFNYISFGIFTAVNSLWTWVAVITAAVSFWRLKTQVKPALQPSNDRGCQPVPETSPEKPCAGVEAANSGTATASSSVCDAKDVEGVRKGKFTLYYCEEEKEVEAKTREVKVLEEDFNFKGGDWWAGLMRVRRSEMEWYSYQDLTVVNGNIVRLWDECRLNKLRA